MIMTEQVSETLARFITETKGEKGVSCITGNSGGYQWLVWYEGQTSLICICTCFLEREREREREREMAKISAAFEYARPYSTKSTKANQSASQKSLCSQVRCIQGIKFILKAIRTIPSVYNNIHSYVHKDGTIRGH